MEITYENIYSFGYLKAQVFNNFYVQAIDPNNKFISIASYTSDNTVVLSSFNDKVGIQQDSQIVARIIKDKNE
jgi:hypothetical protein